MNSLRKLIHGAEGEGGSTSSKPAIPTDPEDFYKVRYNGLTLDEAAIELGFYFALMLITMMLMLDRLRGKYGNLNNWLLTRKLEVFENDNSNSKGVVRMIMFASVFYVIVPAIVLLMWMLLLLYSNNKDGLSL